MMTQANERLTRQLVLTMTSHIEEGTPLHIPEAGRFLWDAFVELSAGRDQGPWGASAIPWSEIRAWAEVMQVPLQPEHYRIIKALDRAWLSAKPAKAAASRELTPALFDAVVE